MAETPLKDCWRLLKEEVITLSTGEPATLKTYGCAKCGRDVLPGEDSRPSCGCWAPA